MRLGVIVSREALTTNLLENLDMVDLILSLKLSGCVLYWLIFFLHSLFNPIQQVPLNDKKKGKSEALCEVLTLH